MRAGLVLLVLAVVLTGCERKPAPPAARPAPAASAAPSVAATPSASHDPAEVLAAWVAAVEARDWRLVRAYWGEHGGASGVDEAGFAAKWNALQAPKVTLGPAEVDGAAGSSFDDVPVLIVDGARRISGHLVWRRVNDVEGASAEQLRWHIESSTLAP